MPETRQETDLIYRKASIVLPAGNEKAGPSSLNVEQRSVGVILATETPVPEWDWEYGIVPTVLLMSGAVLPPDNQIPMLDTHNRQSVSYQIGSLRDLRTTENDLPATAFFSTTRKAEDAFTLVRENHLKDISVGRKDLQYVFVPEGTTAEVAGKMFTGPLKVVTQWEVKEGSFTSLGADKNAKTRAASDGKNREENPMLTPEATKVDGRAEHENAPAVTNPNPPQQNAAPAPENAPVRSEPAAPAPVAVSEEKIRTDAADMLMIGRTHNCVELAEEALRNGTSVDVFRAQVLNHIAGNSERHAPNSMPRTVYGQDESEKFRAAATDALLMRAGTLYAPESPAPGALELRGFTLKEIARECLRMAGKPTAGDPFEVVGRAFTSSDFPNVLANVAHKAVIAGAQEAGETFELWTGEVTANDFREHTGVSLDAFTSLDEVPEGSEYKHGKASDSGVKYAVVTYGKLFPMTRQSIINDNLNAFTAIPMAMGRAAIRTCGNQVYSLLTTNPELADGKTLFHTDRKNMASAGTKITADAFSAGVTAMGTHVGKAEEALNITPAYLLCPIAKKGEALTLLNSQLIGTQQQPNQVNPWLHAVMPVPEARLDMGNKKAWYLAGPKGWAINVAWLFGNKLPRVEQRQGWTIDGVEHKVSIDFGCYIHDWRALYLNPGQ